MSQHPAPSSRADDVLRCARELEPLVPREEASASATAAARLFNSEANEVRAALLELRALLDEGDASGELAGRLRRTVAGLAFWRRVLSRMHPGQFQDEGRPTTDFLVEYLLSDDEVPEPGTAPAAAASGAPLGSGAAASPERCSVAAARPALLTFDVFGTVLDWRRGAVEAVARAGGNLSADRFDELVDAQGRLEQETPGRPYREIVAESVAEVAGVRRSAAAEIGDSAGTWPLFPDSASALARLQRVAPCAAMTNSDRAHADQVQLQLGFRLSRWWCAEEIGCYKPDPRVWEYAARAAGVPFCRAWWHVAAYADYDLAVARRLGLTTVYVERPHRRPGDADLVVPDLAALADLVERA